jgi:hypothetical protein
MKVIKKSFAKFSEFELALGPEKRLFKLEVTELPKEHKFNLFDYFGWPVTDFDLIHEAKNQFIIFSIQLETKKKMGIVL